MPYLLALPALLVFIGILIPFITAVRYSLQRGLTDYVDLLTAPGFWNALLGSLGHACSAGLPELLLGFGIALLLRRPTRVNDALARALLLPLLMTPALPALMWTLMTGPGLSGLARLGSRFAFLPGGWTQGPAPAAMADLLVDVWVNTPWMMFLLLAGLRRMPRLRIAAARQDGVSAAFVLTRIAAPALAPYVLAAAALRLLESIRQFDMLYAMGQDGAAGPLVLRLPAYLEHSRTADAGRTEAALIVIAVITCAIVRLLAAQWRKLRERGHANA